MHKTGRWREHDVSPLIRSHFGRFVSSSITGRSSFKLSGVSHPIINSCIKRYNPLYHSNINKITNEIQSDVQLVGQLAICQTISIRAVDIFHVQSEYQTNQNFQSKTKITPILGQMAIRFKSPIPFKSIFKKYKIFSSNSSLFSNSKVFKATYLYFDLIYPVFA